MTWGPGTAPRASWNSPGNGHGGPLRGENRNGCCSPWNGGDDHGTEETLCDDPGTGDGTPTWTGEEAEGCDDPYHGTWDMGDLGSGWSRGAGQ